MIVYKIENIKDTTSNNIMFNKNRYDKLYFIEL